MSLFSLLSSYSILVGELSLSDIYSKLCTYKQISDIHIFYQERSETCRRFNTIHCHRYFVIYPQKYSNITRRIEIEWVISDFVFADGVNIFAESVNCTNTKHRIIISHQRGKRSRVNAEITKYVLFPREQNAEKCRRIKIDKISFKAVPYFIYQGTTVTNLQCVHEEMQSRLKSKCSY